MVAKAYVFISWSRTDKRINQSAMSGTALHLAPSAMARFFVGIDQRSLSWGIAALERSLSWGRWILTVAEIL